MKTINRRYSPQVITQTLKVYEKCNFVLLQTQKLTGISRQTIRSWLAEYGTQVFSLQPYDEVLELLNEELKINDSSFIRKYYNIRNQLLERIQELISGGPKLEPLVNVFKSISRDPGLFDEMVKKESESYGKSFCDIVTMKVEAMDKVDLLPYEKDYPKNEFDEYDRESEII